MRNWILSQIQRLSGGEAARTTRRLALACGLLAALAVVSACSSKTPTTTGGIPTATPGDIQLATDLSSYSVSQAIGVMVTNASGKTTYFTQDGRSNCSIVELEQYVGGKTPWAAVDACTSIDPPQTLQIPAGLQEPFTLAPTAKDSSNAWDPGEYRIEISYTTQKDGVTNPVIAYSAGFTIHT
jgi:hypothetical protein